MVTVNLPLRGGSGGVVGKIFASLFLAVFLAMGCAFTYLVARSVAGAARTYGWRETPCEIVGNRVARNPSSADPDESFVFDPEYVYEFGGRRYRSRQYRPGYKGSAQVAEAARLAARYPAGSRATCYVDPSHPQNAALDRPSLWFAAMILLPLVFVLVGAGGLVALWWPKKVATETDVPQAISARAAPAGKAHGCLAAFFGLFLAVGLSVFVLAFAKPALRTVSARSWREVPCVVVASRVRTHEGDDGNTYSVDVLYEYEFEGRTYQSNRYGFLGGSSGGAAGKEAVVARHPPGTRTVCYVNPADPLDSVLTRSFTKEYLVGLIPLVFVAAGGGGLLWVASLARKRRRATPADAWGGTSPGPAEDAMRFAAAEEESGPAVLEPAATPIRKFVVILFIMLFWNGIVSVFVWQALKGWRSGHPDGCLTVFLIPFLVVGLLMIAGVFHQFLALFNPRPRLQLSTRSIPLGGSASLDWGFTGAAGRIGRLRIFVEGREECRYRRGTDTHTDREVFATIPVVESAALVGGASGNATLRIPEDTMHSFSAANNKVLWTLKVKGEIRSWPDVEEEFPLTIRPRGRGPSRA